jgi:hypothetical protein
MTKPLDKMTKAELLGVIAIKDNELRALRDAVCVATAPQPTGGKPLWLLEVEARRAAREAAKAEALRTGCTVKVAFA